MKRFVLDASVTLSWFVDEPVSPYAQRIRQMLIDGARGVVPVLWHIEVANGLAVAERRRLISPADVDVCLSHIDSLAAALESSIEPIFTRRPLELARHYGLSAYDAVYLLEALSGGLPLATLDKALRIAATRAGADLVK